jgi:hypothetical protein
MNNAATANAWLAVRENREGISRDTIASVIEATIPDKRGRLSRRC